MQSFLQERKDHLGSQLIGKRYILKLLANLTQFFKYPLSLSGN
jgi:hypothetical protein